MTLIEPIIGDPYCIEICGDGIDLGTYQCDDGNNYSGDGCSGDCKVEEGYSCTGGSEMMPDVCIDIRRPKASIAYISNKFEVKIQFDKAVSNNNELNNETMSLSITNSLGQSKGFNF